MYPYLPDMIEVKKSRQQSCRGFTFMEMLITVIIISILVCIAIPQYTSLVEMAHQKEAVVNMTAIYNAEIEYYFRINPATGEANACYTSNWADLQIIANDLTEDTFVDNDAHWIYSVVENGLTDSAANFFVEAQYLPSAHWLQLHKFHAGTGLYKYLLKDGTGPSWWQN
ncbi:MAG: prepilin-type N-terminal cleavage/methylation domain-containing protein [Candidatus Omnitrophota bacterium]